MTAEADYADTHGGEFTPEMMQDFVSWYAREQGRSGSNLPALHETNVTPTQLASRHAAVDRFVRHRMQTQRATLSTLERDAKQYCAGVKDAPK
jgi:hypothetical protein